MEPASRGTPAPPGNTHPLSKRSGCLRAAHRRGCGRGPSRDAYCTNRRGNPCRRNLPNSNVFRCNRPRCCAGDAREDRCDRSFCRGSGRLFGATDARRWFTSTGMARVGDPVRADNPCGSVCTQSRFTVGGAAYVRDRTCRSGPSRVPAPRPRRWVGGSVGEPASTKATATQRQRIRASADGASDRRVGGRGCGILRFDRRTAHRGSRVPPDESAHR